MYSGWALEQFGKQLVNKWAAGAKKNKIIMGAKMDYKQTKIEIEKKSQAGDNLGAAVIALQYIRERGLDNKATLFAVGGIADHALRKIQGLRG